MAYPTIADFKAHLDDTSASISLSGGQVVRFQIPPVPAVTVGSRTNYMTTATGGVPVFYNNTAFTGGTDGLATHSVENGIGRITIHQAGSYSLNYLQEWGITNARINPAEIAELVAFLTQYRADGTEVSTHLMGRHPVEDNVLTQIVFPVGRSIGLTTCEAGDYFTFNWAWKAGVANDRVQFFIPDHNPNLTPHLDFTLYTTAEAADTDKEYQGLLDGAISYVEQVTFRNFSGTPKTATELINANQSWTEYGGLAFRVKFGDIRSITSIQIGEFDSIDTATSYTGSILNEKYSIIRVSNAPQAPSGVIKIEYTYGTTETPSAISQAILMLATQVGDQSGSDSVRATATDNERIGDYQVGYATGSGGGSRVNTAIRVVSADDLIKPFKQINV